MLDRVRARLVAGDLDQLDVLLAGTRPPQPATDVAADVAQERRVGRHVEVERTPRGLLVRDSTVASGGGESLTDVVNTLTTDTGAAPYALGGSCLTK